MAPKPSSQYVNKYIKGTYNLTEQSLFDIHLFRSFKFLDSKACFLLPNVKTLGKSWPFWPSFLVHIRQTFSFLWRLKGCSLPWVPFFIRLLTRRSRVFGHSYSTGKSARARSAHTGSRTSTNFHYGLRKPPKIRPLLLLLAKGPVCSFSNLVNIFGNSSLEYLNNAFLSLNRQYFT